MNSIDGPRLARQEEISGLLELVDRTFDYGQGGMAAHLPDAYGDPTPEHHAVIRREGTIVAHAGCFPRTLVIDGRELPTREIGGVATDKRYRGDGYMSSLIEFWLSRMDHEGVGLSNLGGDRQRYDRFGWETTGRECAYDITERSFTKPDEEDGNCRFYAGDAADVEAVERLHSTERLRVRRDRERYATLLNQRGYRTLLYEGSDGEAYLTVSDSRTPSRFAGDGRVVVEYGGTETGVTALLGHVISIYDQSSLTLYAHPSHPMTQMFIDQSNDWRLLTHRMVNIHDLETVLSGFTEQVSSRWRAAPTTANGAVTLAMEDGRTVMLSYDADSVTVEATEEPADIRLDRREMTRLLFGFGERQTSGQQDPLLQSVLPLDFYLWRSEWL
jgi:predicted N-acetyltransferase YhbS